MRILNSRVFSLRTTVRAICGSFLSADHTLPARRRIGSSVADNGISRSNVSSAEIDLVGRSGMTKLWSMPRASSYRRVAKRSQSFDQVDAGDASS